ncbi:MAG: STELLO glycosyltransferase family protein [Alphaproteobacteria bacterium]
MPDAVDSIVVTSINLPTPAMQALAAGSVPRGIAFIVVGDTKSPPDFALDGACFLDMAAQHATGFRLAGLCPTRHYARKNIGYLCSIRDGARVIRETDDDNIPLDSFFAPAERHRRVAHLTQAGWANAYAYFSEARIWPRGLPLDAVAQQPQPFETLPVTTVDCPIQQGLADDNPDVDAVYRLLFPLPQRFRADRQLALGTGAWCPFNSQNTTWWPPAFPLLYLPAHCSFRMTDIWRSFVAQRVAWANGWSILFHEATVWQDRNEHDLMADFRQEVPGYLNNRAIADTLSALDLDPGEAAIGENMRRCYSSLVTLGVLPSEELSLLGAWLDDLAGIGIPTPRP